MTSSSTNDSLADRIDRIESQLAIGQLPIRYAIAIDSRDLDAWTALFVADVDCGQFGRGREALKKFIDPNIRTFYRSHHQICGHQIDFVDRDHATGKVYCRAEHEVGKQWYVMAICYFDQYERQDGRWFFKKRSEKHWYAADVQRQPSDDDFQQWREWNARLPALPQAFPSWTRFWQRSDASAIAKLTSRP